MVSIVLSRAARIANSEARRNVQGMPMCLTSCRPRLTHEAAHQVHEARLARKFGGLIARDGQLSYPRSAHMSPARTSADLVDR